MRLGWLTALFRGRRKEAPALRPQFQPVQLQHQPPPQFPPQPGQRQASFRPRQDR